MGQSEGSSESRGSHKGCTSKEVQFSHYVRGCRGDFSLGLTVTCVGNQGTEISLLFSTMHSLSAPYKVNEGTLFSEIQEKETPKKEKDNMYLFLQNFSSLRPWRKCRILGMSNVSK